METTNQIYAIQAMKVELEAIRASYKELNNHKNELMQENAKLREQKDELIRYCTKMNEQKEKPMEYNIRLTNKLAKTLLKQ